MLGPGIMVARTMQCWKGNWNFLLLNLESTACRSPTTELDLHHIHNNKHPQLENRKCHSTNIHWQEIPPNLDAVFFCELPMAPMTRICCPGFLFVIYVYRVVAVADLYLH